MKESTSTARVEADRTQTTAHSGSSAASPRILRLTGVKAKSGLGRDTIYRLAREGRFPKPIKLSERATGWLASEIDAWIASRVAASRASDPKAA